MLSTPILFLVFNRPKETKVVFEAIRKMQPRQLFVAADGPRMGRSDDSENCKAVREIIQAVDWDCEVKTLFRERNMGCRNAVSEGITWFFDNVEEGIILEDDCLPHPSFFNFCETLLAHYRNTPDVMHIGGNNFQNGIQRGDGSYYFSKIPHIWGWASWRRAWNKYDVDMKGLEDFLNGGHKEIKFKTSFEKDYWLETFKKVQRGKVDTWDYQWTFALMSNKGKAITPQVNMVTNIGFGTEATHTGNTGDKLGKLEVAGMETITHPTSQEIDREADYYWYKTVLPWQLKLKSVLKKYTG